VAASAAAARLEMGGSAVSPRRANSPAVAMLPSLLLLLLLLLMLLLLLSLLLLLLLLFVVGCYVATRILHIMVCRHSIPDLGRWDVSCTAGTDSTTPSTNVY
jgi:hypothetical protein